MFRRQPPSNPYAPRPVGPAKSSDEMEAWAMGDDFATFEEGADRVIAPALSFEEKERLVREQIPDALRGLAAAVVSPKLTAAERGDMARAAATLGVDFISGLDAAQLAPWEKASLRETARLLGGRGGVPFTFDAKQGGGWRRCDGEGGGQGATRSNSVRVERRRRHWKTPGRHRA